MKRDEVSNTKTDRVGIQIEKLDVMNVFASPGLAKEWCEDPVVVSIDAVVCNHRVTLTAAGDADERSGTAW